MRATDRELEMLIDGFRKIALQASNVGKPTIAHTNALMADTLMELQEYRKQLNVRIA